MARSRQEHGGRRRLVAGAALVALGALVLLVTGNVFLTSGAPSAREARSISTSLIAGLAVVAYGVVLVVEARRDASGAVTPETPRAAGGPPAPMATGKGDAASPAPSGADSVAEPASVAPVAVAPSPVASLLTRSDDLVPTLRDLVAHAGSERGYGDLPALLEGMGAASWEVAFRVRASRLRRNGRWWLTYDEEGASERERERILALEAALNVSDDLAAGPWRGDEPLSERVGHVLARVVDLPLSVEGRRPPADASSAFDRFGDERGEWRCRARFSCLCENAAAPFRITLAFQANLEAGLLVADVAVPSPGCLAVGLVPAEGRGTAARDYALRIALLVGRAAFMSSPLVGRAVVNCLPLSGDKPLLSLDLTPDALTRLRPIAREDDALCRALSAGDPAVRAIVAPDGWLRPVGPFLSRRDELACPAGRFRLVELDGSPCKEALVASCGARRVRDLGIMEKAGRAAAWARLSTELGGSTQEAVSLLVATRDAADDVTVAEACERVIKALVEGESDVSDSDALEQAFVNGGTLASCASHLRAAINGNASPTELERALEGARAVLDPISQTGIYLDDCDAVFRYFNSTAERVLYNLSGDAGTREVRLVPDEYYTVLTGVMQVLTMLGRPEEALAWGDELMRVAPVTPDALLSVVRGLEETSRPFEAIDLLRKAIGLAPTARDLAICLYRLAYMEWRVGRSPLAAACYQQAIALQTDMAEQARRELEDLLASEPSLSPLREGDAERVLVAEGLLTVSSAERERALLEAAASCADAGLFPVARALCGSAVEFNRDDALAGVYRSLQRP